MEHLQKAGSAVAELFEIPEPTPDAVRAAMVKLGHPLVIKNHTLAYDGRGNFVICRASRIQEALVALKDRPLYAEKQANFEREVAVVVVRTVNGSVAPCLAVEIVHRDSICLLAFAPLSVGYRRGVGRPQTPAESAVLTFEGAGIFGVEMFQLPDVTLYINENPPRPHNSGHYTIEACETSQFENHIRAILDLPLGATSVKASLFVRNGTVSGYDKKLSSLRMIKKRHPYPLHSKPSRPGKGCVVGRD